MAHAYKRGLSIKVDRRNVDSAKPADEDKDLFITVFTDGSFCPNTRAFGIGVWIRDGSQPIFTFGDGGIGANDAGEVESKGLKAAARYILENCDIEGRVLVIQCDNIGALNRMDIKPFKDRGAKFVKKKHVKGHTSHQTNRSKVNAVVDEIAGRHMREYREKARGQRNA